MAAHKLLLPYNFSDSDRKALDFAIDTFGHRDDIEVTLFHAYTPLPSIEVSNDTVTGRLKQNVAYLNQKVSELEAALLGVKEELVRRGFSDEKVKLKFKPRKKEIAAEIIDFHTGEKFTLLVLNRKPGRIGRFFTGSVHTKVAAALRNATVCIVC
ncbi:MAG: universal stress protein [Desulfobacterales bacterium]